MVARASSGHAMTTSTPSPSTLSWESVTSTATSMSASRCRSRPVISQSIQTMRSAEGSTGPAYGGSRAGPGTPTGGGARHGGGRSNARRLTRTVASLDRHERARTPLVDRPQSRGRGATGHNPAPHGQVAGGALAAGARRRAGVPGLRAAHGLGHRVQHGPLRTHGG